MKFSWTALNHTKQRGFILTTLCLQSLFSNGLIGKQSTDYHAAIIIRCLASGFKVLFRLCVTCSILFFSSSSPRPSLRPPRLTHSLPPPNQRSHSTILKTKSKISIKMWLGCRGKVDTEHTSVSSYSFIYTRTKTWNSPEKILYIQIYK